MQSAVFYLFRYSTDTECKWYKYKGFGAENCVLIHKAYVDHEIFISSSQNLSEVSEKAKIFLLINLYIAYLTIIN